MAKFARPTLVFALVSIAVAMSASCMTEEDPLVAEPFAIRVVDSESRRPVPLVELRSVHGVKIFTDNAGMAVFDEPGFAGRKTYFHVGSPGYSMAADGFDFRGKRIPVRPGEVAQIEVVRGQLAERMFRITGAGRFCHSVRAGLLVPEWGADLNADVLGQDSAHSVVFGKKQYWFWGDTNRAEYPLGIFDTTGATTAVPAPDPEVSGIALTYFRDAKGDARAVAEMPGQGPSWLSGFTVLEDKKGKEHLVAIYVKVRGFVDVYERGLCEWDPVEEKFEHVYTFPEAGLRSSLFPQGHPVRHRVEGKDFVYYGTGFPEMRIEASYETWRNPGRYEKVECDVDLKDVESGSKIDPHYVSIAWNEFRERFVAVFARKAGMGEGLSETWVGESPDLEGPWRSAVQVATHGAHSFYNPLQHPEFAKGGGKVIYFEGTYTTLFAKGAVPTPRWDYNQILYRLDMERVGELLVRGK